MTYLIRSLVVASAVAVAGASQALLIDNFSVPQSRLILSSVGSAQNEVSGLTPFTHRTQILYQDVNTDPQDARNTSVVISGSAAYSSDAEVDGRYRLIYHFNDNTTGLNLSAVPIIRLNMGFNDVLSTVSVNIISWNAAQSQFQTSNTQVVVGPSLTPFQIQTNGWSQPVFWSDVRSVSLWFNPVQGGDFVLNSVEAVPEPASMLALGAGVAALLARRRRR